MKKRLKDIIRGVTTNSNIFHLYVWDKGENCITLCGRMCNHWDDWSPAVFNNLPWGRKCIRCENKARQL